MCLLRIATNSLAAGESSESVNVVGARLRWVVAAACTVLVASLHVLKHLSALAVAETVGAASEVRGEEGTEGGDAGGDGSGTSHGVGVRRREEEGRVDLETLQVGVSELANREAVHTLEGVASHESGMRVVYDTQKTTNINHPIYE